MLTDHPTHGRPRILGVFAHPDDEVFCAGGTLASWADAGAETLVVSATRGQAGQSATPARPLAARSARCVNGS